MYIADKQEKIAEFLANMTEDEKIILGHQLADFILYCEYKGKECDMRYV
jgi:hypothetical protein